MKTFITTDFYIQSLLFFLLLMSVIPYFQPFVRDFGIAVYFLIAVVHLISANRKMFSNTYEKSILFLIYYIISMLFIITLFSLAVVDEISVINRFWTIYGRRVMSFAIYGTPVLALIYYLICANDYRRQLKKQNSASDRIHHIN
ncbi:signal transduction histidine kinase [Chryseobacterium sp. SORGH_AS 447]|uniref:hypothetical protein n=1 Tax=Chryseobacterium sp. SORGH_AS_0447 TaxID=3041769 RepID=UPI00277D93AF|nr:hypothetical protein [Chryseobacterium sp. SORGH_AS_0447]MDQ1161559.1 signal transduction histidine kinase [Chryseobacterium sp. SORGH_AS_0447]